MLVFKIPGAIPPALEDIIANAIAKTENKGFQGLIISLYTPLRLSPHLSKLFWLQEADRQGSARCGEVPKDDNGLLKFMFDSFSCSIVQDYQPTRWAVTSFFNGSIPCCRIVGLLDKVPIVPPNDSIRVYSRISQDERINDGQDQDEQGN